MRKPKHLIPPCGRSRQSTITWLLNVCHHRGGREYDSKNWLFCFNVKLGPLDFSFENLAKRFLAMGHDEPSALHLNAYAKEYREALATMAMPTFEEEAINDARARFRTFDNGDSSDEAFTTLWDGTNVKARYAFYGRSGGWLVMTDFEGTELTVDAELEEFRLDDWDFPKLRRLAEMVWFVKRATDGDNPRRAVEEAAAWAFFTGYAWHIGPKEDAA